jgi:cytochrome c oxidase assembly protein subunit 11
MNLLPRDPKLRTLTGLVGLVLTMGTLSFAAVPFYDWFCRVTGYGGTTGVAEAAPGADRILDRVITVRFDANVEAGMPWTFVPVEREMTLRIGETALAFYRATNTANRPVAGTASFNVSPDQAGGYFDKIACFCFTEQILQPGESVDMPVSFFVDPEIVEHPEAKFIKHITLSYTFFETPLPEDQALAAPAAPAPVN